MKELLTPLKRLALQICLLLLLYFISRCVFVLINLSFFHDLTLSRFLKISLSAIRFDLATILLFNGVYIILFLLPLPLFRKQPWSGALQWFFIVSNSIAFLFEISDWAYFPFTLKRSTTDVLDMISRKGDFWILLPHFFIDYWYAPLGFIFFMFLFIKVNNKVVKYTPVIGTDVNSIIRLSLQIVMLLVVAGLVVIGFRGGLQRVPITNSTALQVADAKYVPIVLNTPFSITHSFSDDKLEEMHFFTDAELKNYFNPIKLYKGKQFIKKNVVVIILESFSKQFTGLGTRKSYTPFLDSLAKKSFVCRQGYANALHSAEGIPAIIAGIPSLMDEPFTTSVYGTDQITALPGLLKKEGYSTAFYHGGTDGTMSFDVFCAGAGYDEYYGRYEYDNEKDYDGNWGIWDEPFLQYFAKGMSKMKEPFFTTVFTLSSHDPFKVPEKYRKILPSGPLPIEQCIAYTDMSLRSFFETAEKQSWYKNTLFVITADHCALLSEDPRDNDNMNYYSIPILFYAPGETNNETILSNGTDEIAQQIDILPSVLDYLGYPKPFFAFGNSIFRTAPVRFEIADLGNSYHWLMDNCLLKTNGMDVKGVYRYPADTFCQNNLLGKPEDTMSTKIIPYFHAFVQLYRSALIHNNMKVVKD